MKLLGHFLFLQTCIFRITPGNINDISTMTGIINDLNMHDVETDFVLMDAGYFTDSNIAGRE